MTNKNYCSKLKNFITIELPPNIILFFWNFVRTSSIVIGTNRQAEILKITNLKNKDHTNTSRAKDSLGERIVDMRW